MATKQTLNVVRKSADNARRYTSARNVAIVEAQQDGHTYRAIAEASGLSHEGVRRILAEHAKAERRAKDRARRAARKTATVTEQAT